MEMTGKRYCLRKKRSLPCYRKMRKTPMIGGNGCVQTKPSRKKPEYTIDGNAQKYIEDQSKATADEKEIFGKNDCTVDDCETIRSNKKKLKIVIKKNSETGKWSADEELFSEANKCAGDSLLDSHFRENENGKPVTCSDVKSIRKRKSAFSVGTERKTDCKKMEQNNEIVQIKSAVDMIRKKSASKVLCKKNPVFHEKTVRLHNSDYGADELEEEDTSHLDALKSVKIKPVTLTNEKSVKNNEYQYDSKDVYVVEFFDEGDPVLSKDKECRSEVKENIDESVHIKLLPLSTAECKKDPSPETEELDLQITLNEKEDENSIDETGIEKGIKIKSRSIKERVVEKVSGVNDIGIRQTSEKESRKISKNYKEMKLMHWLTDEKNQDVDIMDYSAKLKFTDLNDKTCQKYTEVAETLPCQNELSAKNDKDMKETVIEINTDVNKALVRKAVNVNDVAREQKSNSVEETGKQDKALNKTAVNNFNTNEKISEKDLYISETRLDPLLQLDNLNRSPGNIKDIEEWLNWTVAQTLYPNNKIKAETPGTSQTCNMQDNIIAVNHLESKSSELIDDNNNCLIEVYVLDDTDRNNKTETLENDTDSKYEACADSEVKIPNTCEIIVYDDTSDMKNSICNESQGSTVSGENLVNFSLGECSGYKGYVNGETQKECMYQSMGNLSPVADAACTSMSPVTDLRYKNIPYWDPCLLPKIKTIDKKCDKKHIPVIQRQQKRKSKTKIETGLGLNFEKCGSADKFINDNYVPNDRASKVSVEAAMQCPVAPSEYEENAEIKHSYINDSMSVAKAENENTGLIICNTKLANDGKKSVKVKKEPTKNKMCLSKGFKRNCKRKNDELFIKISDCVAERKKMLRKLKNGQYGHRPHVVRVREGGIIADVTEEYRQFLPYKEMSC